MNIQALEFEKPLIELEKKIEELKLLAGESSEADSELKKLEKKADKLRKNIFSNMSSLQRTQLSRHPNRPYSLDYIDLLFDDFMELHGDRNFKDDPAIVAGMGKLKGKTVFVIGHQKGRNTNEKIYRNFGMPNPEGYRKALRVMEMAERFNKPIITFIDTPGAYPGIGAEERGQGEAIARNLREMSMLKVPIICIVIGEGGSGGALALGVGDSVQMMENSIYSVISPEGCAAILWKSGEKAGDAAEALKITAANLKDLGVIDNVIPEPVGGAHRDHKQAALFLEENILAAMKDLECLSVDELLERRYNKFRQLGHFKG
ncbi:MAG: acetyl-CoA carboxylase carboxyltransferase subunit alpha [Deltaproteobacteria bacterium]|nr:acetyl-CoA carboxylase carboxyltransferase subunit alpha [Deltaproteobacteria bacterium]